MELNILLWQRNTEDNLWCWITKMFIRLNFSVALCVIIEPTKWSFYEIPSVRLSVLGLFVSLFVYIFLISCMKLGCFLTKKVTERHIKKNLVLGFWAWRAQNGSKMRLFKYHKKLLCKMFLIFHIKLQQYKNIKLA